MHVAALLTHVAFEISIDSRNFVDSATKTGRIIQCGSFSREKFLTPEVSQKSFPRANKRHLQQQTSNASLRVNVSDWLSLKQTFEQLQLRAKVFGK